MYCYYIGRNRNLLPTHQVNEFLTNESIFPTFITYIYTYSTDIYLSRSEHDSPMFPPKVGWVFLQCRDFFKKRNPNAENQDVTATSHGAILQDLGSHFGPSLTLVNSSKKLDRWI